MRQITDRAKKWFLVAKVCVVLVLLAILGAWAPIIAKEILELPSDYTYTADIISYDNLYNAQAQQYSGRTQSQTVFSYTTKRVDGKVNVIEALFDVHTQEGEPIFSVKREYGVSSETFQHVKGYGDKDRGGYLFGPSGSNKNDFEYWHINYDQPLTMKFQDEESILGLDTYRYTSVFRADQTASLTNLPDVGKTRGINLDGTISLWIEPVTGELIKYEDSATAYYYDLATGARISPWNQFSNQFSFDSVAGHVTQTEQRKSEVLMAMDFVPAVPLLLIAVFTAWCALDIKSLVRSKASGRAVAINSAMIMVCVIVIASWIFEDSTHLINLFGTTSEMHPITATSILLICACNLFLALKATPTRRQRHLIDAVLIVVAVIAGVNTILSIANIEFFLRGGAASIYAGVSFGVGALALLSVARNSAVVSGKRIVACRILVYLVLLLSGISIIGNAYQLDFAKATGWNRSVNISTAVLFILIVAANWDARYPFLKKVRSLKGGVLRQLATAVLIVFVGVSLTGVMYNLSKNSVTSNATLRFENDTNRIQGLIAQRLDSFANALLGGKSLFDASDSVTRGEWKAYVDGLQLAENYPGNQGMGYSPIVPAAQKQAVEQQVRSEGYPNFMIKPTDPARDPYTTIIYIEPFDARNQRSFGYDMFSEPVRRDAMQRARNTGEVAMSGKVTLLQETSENIQAGFLMYAPQYRKGTANNNEQQRQQNIQGYVFSPVRMNNFMQAAIGDQSSGVGVAIYDTADAAQTNSENQLFNSDPEVNFAKADLVKTSQIEIGGRVWTMRYASLPGYISGSSQNTPIYALLGGLGISVLLGAAYYGLASSRQRALGLARQMTGSLEKEKDRAVRLQNKDEAILSSIGEGLILYSTKGIIERVNAAALMMLGEDEKDIVGRKFTEALKAADEKGKAVASDRRPSMLALHKGMAISTKLRYERKDGTKFPAEITVAPIMSGSRSIGAIEVFRDITKEVELDQAKTDFISLASHQLRAPLTANKWYLEMLLTGSAGKLRPEQADFVDKIDISNERLIDLVASLLNITRIESGRLSIKPKLTDFRKLIDDAVETVRPKFNDKKQQVIIDVANHPKLTLDENMIRQVLLNLLTNANKYSPNKATIHIRVTQLKSQIQCEVSDEGYGIPADQQKSVFDRFFRAKNIAEKEPEGNGLGLYLIKQIVEASGGKIWFDSVENKGTTFYFTLPLKGVPAHKGEVSLEEHGQKS